MDTSSDARQTAGTAAAKGGRLLPITMIVIFDVAAPLVAYKVLRSAGLSAVSALLLSGVFPALGVTIGAIRNRRLDAVGALVLTGIVVGTLLGLVSLWARHPLMFSVVREFTGPDTAKGQEMTRLWHHEQAFRRDFRVVTAVWGVGFLIEAALRIVIVYNVSTGTALAISKVMPFLFGGIVSAWTLAYGAYRKKQAVRMAIAAAAVKEASSPEITQAADHT